MKYTLETSDIAYSNSKAKMYIGSYIVDDETNLPKEGEVTLPDGTIMRFKNGRIDGNGEPALEYEDGGVEYWKQGYPDGSPAIIQDFGTKMEYWENGKLRLITSELEIEKLN